MHDYAFACIVMHRYVTRLKHSRDGAATEQPYRGPMLARIRLVVPDRPGMLGAVASAIGSAGADVDLVDVLAAEHGRATDDIRVRVRDDAHLQRVVDTLERLTGVTVDGVRRPVSPLAGHGDLELIRTILATPLPQVLVDQAATSLEMNWVAATSPDAPAASTVIASSPTGPPEGIVIDHPVRLGLVPPDALAYAFSQMRPATQPDQELPPVHVLMVPLDDGGPAMLLGREGASFHVNEVHRFAELGRIVGKVLSGMRLDA